MIKKVINDTKHAVDPVNGVVHVDGWIIPSLDFEETWTLLDILSSLFLFEKIIFKKNKEYNREFVEVFIEKIIIKIKICTFFTSYFN